MRRDYVPLFARICTSGRMADLQSHDSRLFYVLLLTQCDAWGRITADPRALTAMVWSMFGETASGTRKALLDLERVGLIETHSDGAERWIQIPDWEEKAGTIGKKERRGRSSYPEGTPDSVLTNSGLTPDQVPHRGEESRAEESKAENPPTPRKRGKTAGAVVVIPASLDTPAFRENWEAYVADRKARHKPVTDRAAKMAMDKMEPWGEAKAIAALRLSIERGWQGVFEPDPAFPSRGPSQAPAVPPAVRVAQVNREAHERDVERRWVAANTKPMTRIGLDGQSIHYMGLDRRYPGCAAAERELAQAVAS